MTRDLDPIERFWSWILDLVFGKEKPKPNTTHDEQTAKPADAKSSLEQLPYQNKFRLLTRGELAFFRELQSAVADDYLIFAMVRFADLVYLSGSVDNWQTHFNKIQSKHIDFLLCDHKTTKPLLAIELDDKSHQRKDRMERDKFVDAALDAAELPILRIKAAASYDPRDIHNKISEKIGVLRTL